MIVIATTPKQPGYFSTCCAGLLLCCSRQPLLDGARRLLAGGYSADAMVEMRYADSQIVSVVSRQAHCISPGGRAVSASTTGTVSGPTSGNMTGAPTGTVTGVPTCTGVPTVTGAAGGAAVARHHLADRRAAMTFNLGGVAA